MRKILALLLLATLALLPMACHHHHSHHKSGGGKGKTYNPSHFQHHDGKPGKVYPRPRR